MVVTFTITRGEDIGKMFRLAEGEAKSVGRGGHAEFSVGDLGVSRMHCRLRHQNGACYLQDLGSRNGTSVNGVRVTEEVRLADGDVLAIGTMVAMVHIESSRDEPKPDAGIPLSDAEESVVASLEKKAAPADAARTSAGRLSLRIQPRELLGTIVGGCRIEQLLGQNDISCDCLATQISMERPVVLKILFPAMTSDRRSVERFNAAARAGGKLSHPNIVRIYDAGEEKGWHFIAMEHVDGKSVRQLLADEGRNRPLKIPQALEIAGQAAGALAYAHSVSVIHGHVTQDTVLVTSHGMAKLAAVGFAPGAVSFPDHRPSTPGLLEEIQFTPPELFTGARAPTPQCDIYSLGVVLFLMVTGRMPFRGAAGKELLVKIRKGQHESARRLRREMPESLGQLLDRALATAPADRFPSAAELHAALLKHSPASK